jgi:hypothetical protein
MPEKPLSVLPYNGEPYTIMAPQAKDTVHLAMQATRVIFMQRRVSQEPMRYRAELVIAPKGIPTNGTIVGIIME